MKFMNLNNLVDQLIEDEAIKLKPYRDSVGKLTIGIGRNLDDVGITKNEAIYLCKNNINEVYIRAKKYPWFLSLDDVRQNAILNMMFNLGEFRFSKFHKMISALEANDFAEAANQALDSRWATQVGERAKRIARDIRMGMGAS